MDKLPILLDKISELRGVEPILRELPEEYSVAKGMIIVSATSKRHGQGIADGILSLAKKLSEKPLGVEGYSLAEWILIDYNDVIIHIMQKEARELYNLEKLWPLTPKNEDL